MQKSPASQKGVFPFLIHADDILKDTLTNKFFVQLCLSHEKKYRKAR